MNIFISNHQIHNKYIHHQKLFVPFINYILYIFVSTCGIKVNAQNVFDFLADIRQPCISEWKVILRG